MSDIKVLQQRAMEIRRRYDQLEKSQNRQPWNGLKMARGFKKDVADLIHLMEQGMMDRKKLNHELADCLWSVLVIARKLDVDIERAFWTAMGELEHRIEGQLK